MDFIGPLPEDEGFNCIVTMTDWMGLDIQIVPTRMDIAAEDFAQLFFDHWYCENSLPLELILDRDKLFVSRFWKALTKITGIKPGISTAFHLETDEASEQTNKTVNQCLRYHVTRNQQGWVRALPRVCFAIRNTVNRSTGFSPFQLHTSCSPRMIPSIMVDVRGLEDMDAVKVIDQIEADVAEAKDNLMLAKIFQADNANRKRRPEDVYKENDLVMLSMANRRKDYVAPGSGRLLIFPNPHSVVPSVLTLECCHPTVASTCT